MQMILRDWRWGRAANSVMDTLSALPPPPGPSPRRCCGCVNSVQYTHTHPAFEVGVSVWGGEAEKKKTAQFSNPVTYLRCTYFNYAKIYLTVFNVCV